VKIGSRQQGETLDPTRMLRIRWDDGRWCERLRPARLSVPAVPGLRISNYSDALSGS
jgi:hypothetical protein